MVTSVAAGILAAVVLSFSSSVVALNNGAAKTPQLGWSTWCTGGPCGADMCTETEVQQAAIALATTGLQDLGYEWVLLDDCWAADYRTSNGTLTWSVDRFPSGMPALAAWLHARGLRLGLYTSAGNATCDRGGRRKPIPGSEGHYQTDMNTFAAWGVDYVKADWCGDVKKLPLDGLAVGAADYTAISAAITNTTPARTMMFMGVAAKIFLWDSVPRYANAWRASQDHHDNWANLMAVVAEVQLLGVPGASGAWSDMDVLMTGGEGCSGGGSAHCPGMEDAEYVTEYSLWNLHQSPLNVATDIRNMTAIMNRTLLNRRFTEIHQDIRTPPGKFAGTDTSCGYWDAKLVCQVWTRPLADGTLLVVLFNAASDRDAPAVPITIDFASLDPARLPYEWNATTRVVAEDLWNTTAGSSTASTGFYTSKPIAPHSVTAVVLHPLPVQKRQ